MEKYIIGCVSGMSATLFIQPIDQIKVQIQLNPLKKRIDTIKSIYQQKIFYKGISIALLRQSVYGTLRLGLFQDLKDNYKINPLIASTTAATVATIINNPIDYWLVNKQTNTSYSLSKDISIKGYKYILFNGLKYNLLRAISINIGFGIKPYIYNQFQEKNYFNLFLSNGLSSFISSLCGLPFDILRTYSYKSISTKNIINFKILWISYPVFAGRIIPHSFLSLTFLDLYSNLYYSIIKKNKNF